MNPFYPWQAHTWKTIITARQQQRLPHAFLLQGMAGLGKTHFARSVADYLLCTQPIAHGACGQCRACIQLAAGTHPDYYALIPEKVGRGISIESVRTLNTQLKLTARGGGYKTILIASAESMNEAAANALLKTLEEPCPRTLFLLVTAHPSLLLSTLRSRCHSLMFPVPPALEVLPWLKQQNKEISVAQWSSYLTAANGAPLQALALSEPGRWQEQCQRMHAYLDVALAKRSPLTVALEWKNLHAIDVLHTCLQALAFIVRAKSVGLHALELPWPSDLKESVETLLPRCSFNALFEHLEHCYQLLAVVHQHTSYNALLLFEDLLLDCLQRFDSSGLSKSLAKSA